MIYSVSYFDLGNWYFVWGAKPTKAPRGDGTDSNMVPANLLLTPKAPSKLVTTLGVHSSDFARNSLEFYVF